MRIKRISVKKLFGMFDHDISLNQDSRISIIHGPNGIGKTVLMKMIDGIFTSKYGIFADLPFESFAVDLSSGERICVDGTVSDSDGSKLSAFDSDDRESVDLQALEIRYYESTASEPLPYTPKITEHGMQKVRELTESRPELDSIGSDRWANVLSGDLMTIDDVIKAYDLQGELYSEPTWLKKIKKQTKTGFIQAQRLQDAGYPGRYGYPTFTFSRRRRTSSTPRATVVRYSQEIAKEIRDALAAYAQESQIRDRSFPKRLMESETTDILDGDRLQTKLDDLEAKTAKLINLGLFEDKDIPDIPKVDNTQDNLTNVLSIYVQDIEEKLSKVDAISKQLETLIDIINSRFMCKTLEVDKQQGFVFKDNDNNEIPKTSLSSGEQHELVMIYQLLFHVKHNSLILIDEPELSLHVDWQEKFLKDLQRIIKLREFDLLIATHSPTLVDDKWEWVVGLQYPEGVC